MGANGVAERQSTGLGINHMGSGPGEVITSPEDLNRSQPSRTLPWKICKRGWVDQMILPEDS